VDKLQTLAELMRKGIIAAFLWIFLVPLDCAHTQETGKEIPKPEIALAGVSTGTPAVEIPETSFDFGEMKDGNDYVHAFAIWNTGNGVLEIKKVLPG
jgi:hypothetical protein